MRTESAMKIALAVMVLIVIVGPEIIRWLR